MKIFKIVIFSVILLLFVCAFAEVPEWEVIPGTQYSMQIYSQVDFMAQYFANTNPNNIVAAFGPDGISDCRAIAYWNEYNQYQLWYMTIVSNAEPEENENITFKIYDAVNDQILDCRESITFSDNVVIGSYDSTFLLTIPYIIDDLYGAYEDSLLTILPASGVLINDYISQNYIDEFWVVLDQNVSHGSLNFNNDGSFEYMPEENYYGSDFFEYYATDGDYITSNALVEIQVQPINDPPQIDLPDEGYSFPEDTVFQVDFSPYISDVDNSVLILTYSNNEYIQIMINGFNVTMTPLLNWNGIENVQFTINDNTGRSIASDIIPIEVTPVNDPPLVIEPIEDFDFNEDTVDTHLNLYNTFNDVDTEILEFNVMDNINLNVQIDGNGNVSISSYQENWNGAETIIFIASDLEYTVYDTVTVTVLEVNDPPVVQMELPDLELMEDFEEITVNLDDYFFDIDGDELYYSAQFNNSQILISIDNDYNTMTIYSVANWAGITQVTISAQDNFAARYVVSDTFQITVLEENDPPVNIVPLPDVTMLEDAEPVQRNLNYYFIDYDNDVLTFSVTYDDTEMNVWIIDDILYFQPVANWFGTSPISVTAADQFNDVTDTFNVTVNPVNDAPYVYFEIPDITIEENFDPITLDLYNYFADVDNNILFFSASLSEQNSVVLNIIDGILTISSLPQWNGSVDVTITAQDDESAVRLTASDTFTIEVVPTNDPPYLVSPIDDYNKLEDFASFEVDLAPHFADPENDLITYSVVYNEQELNVEVNASVLSISSVFNWNGTSDITVYASDGIMGNEQAMDQFSVIVQPVNDIPFVEVPIDDYYLDEDFAPFTIDLNDHFSDYDDELEYSVEFDADFVMAAVNLNILSINSLLNVYGDTEITVTAFDGNRAQISDAFMIYINPVNDQPVIALPDSIQFYEDNDLQVDFSQYINDIDSENLLLTYEGNTNVLIDIVDLVVTFSNTENWNGSEMITFNVSDGEFNVSDQVLIIVLPQADVLTLNLPDSFIFNEDESLTVNFNSYISNPDNMEIELSYDGAEWVTVDINNFMVSFGSYQDWNGTDEITFTINNINGPDFSSDIVSVIVMPVNDPPEVTPVPDQYILEDSGMHSIDLNAYFYDVDGDVLQYSAIFDSDNLNVGVIYPYLNFEPLSNWNGTTEVIVTAVDNINRFTVRDTFNVIVEPVNDAPYIVTYLNNITKAEDFMPFTVDFTDNFADIDNDILYYSIDFNSDNVNIDLVGTTLEISSVLNWNGATTISVTASDIENRLSVTDDFILTVTPVNDYPVLDVPFDDLYLMEDFDDQFINLSDHFSDPDNVLTYSVYANAGEINASVNGDILSLQSVHNWNGTTSIQVIANDLQNRAVISDTFDVYITPVNDAPVIVSALDDITINEDTVSEQVNLNNNFSDIDGDILVYSAQVSDPNGIINIDVNIMTVTAAENWYGFFDAYITADDQMGRASVTDTIHVVVMPVNDPPYVVTPLPDLEFTEDFEPYSYDLSQNFDDIECDQLYYNADYNPENIALILNGSIMQISSIDNWAGSTQVEIFISDQLCRAVITDTFTVTVIGENDPPYVASPIPNQFKNEDFGSFSIDLDLYFADVDGDPLSYSASANDTIVSLDVQANLLYMNSILNLNGIVQITVIADDGFNRLTASDVFTLNIAPVNDPPLLLLPEEYTFDEDTSLVVDFMQEGYIYDIDSPQNELELNASGGVNVIVEINGTIVTFYAENNWFGTEAITFSLADEVRFVVYDTVNVVVNPVNDPPYFAFQIPDQQILEGDLFNPIDLNYYVNDVDDPDATLLWSYSGNTDLLVDINPATHFATVSAPDPDWNGNEDITFTVEDSFGESVFDIVNFEIIPVNDAPIVQTPIPDQYVEINFASFDITLSDYFYDVDGDPLTYSVVYNQEEIEADVNADVLTISSIINWYGASEVVVTADDNVTRATVSDTFIVDITYQVTQHMDLGVMWNWISFYVQPDDYSLDYVFGPLGNNINTVKYQTQSADYIPDYNDWFGDLESIQDGGGYLVHVTDPVPGFSLTGNRIMSNTPINMIEDWNWIGYYPPSPDSLTSALDSILDNVHIVKNQTQSAEYFSEVGNGVWFGDLQIMAPGIGYKVQMDNPDILVYPLYPVITRDRDDHAQSMPDNSPDEWLILPGTSDNMIMMLTAQYNDDIYSWAENRAMGVFDADGICRSHGIWQQHSSLDQGFWYFTIVGNCSGTDLYIRLIDENGNEIESSDSITFLPDNKIGGPFEPYQVNFYPVDDDDQQIVPANTLNQNYPNPFNPETTISFVLSSKDNVELNIFNLRGEKIKTLIREQREAGSYSAIWDGTDNNGNKVASGIYFYSISTSKYSATRKMVMIK